MAAARFHLPPQGAYTPSQIQTAYGFNKITFSEGTIKGDGSGQTIAIVDAYGDPNISSDLAAFDSTFKLQAPPNFTIAKPAGHLQTNSGWALETSLDVEWAHAMAPGANILLVEAKSSSLSNLLSAVNYASQNANVVSMSWGGSEFSSETSYDSYFTTPGVTFVASSGDSGAPPIWPAVSPNVVAVGGTTLTLNSSGGYGSESGWSDSGGGISAYESKPAYQSSVTQSSTKRTNPDVAYNANPNTGYAVYDTVSYDGQTGWFQVGGTSAGAPQWSALVAIANQGRQAANNNTPNPLSGSGTLHALYNMAGSTYIQSGGSTSYFHDITSGNNGYFAGPGYDLVTGLGSPQAQNVVNYLLGASASVSPLTASPSTSGSTNTTTTNKHGHSSVFLAGSAASSSFLLAPTPADTAAIGSAIMAQPAQTSSAFNIASASLASLAFGAGQTPTAAAANSSNQTASQSTALLGRQSYAPAPKSVSSPSAALGNYLSPFGSESADGVPMIGTEEGAAPRGDGSLAPLPPFLGPGPGDISLDLTPPVLTQARSVETLACDACFLDEASMALVAEETLALADRGQVRLRVPGLALLGVLAGSLWLAPDAAEEMRKRRGMLLV